MAFLFLSETQSEAIMSVNNAWSIWPLAFLLPDNFWIVEITEVVAGPYFPLGPPLDLISLPAEVIPSQSAVWIAKINPLPFIFLSESESPLFKGKIALAVSTSLTSFSSLITLTAIPYCVFALVIRSSAWLTKLVTSEYVV